MWGGRPRLRRVSRPTILVDLSMWGGRPRLRRVSRPAGERTRGLRLCATAGQVVNVVNLQADCQSAFRLRLAAMCGRPAAKLTYLASSDLAPAAMPNRI